MLSQMNKIGQFGRAVTLLAKRHSQIPMSLGRSLTAIEGADPPSSNKSLLSHKVRSYIDNETTSIRELNSVLHLMLNQKTPDSLIALVEEKLLNLMTIENSSDDLLVAKYMPMVFDYESICYMLMHLAELKRRPTPLLKAASSELCRLSREGIVKPKPLVIISTLKALVKLNYPNRALISRLISDLTQTINMEEMTSDHLCSLLRSIGAVRWRSDALLKMFFNHIRENGNDLEKVDHHIVITLLHIISLLDYKPDINIEEFFRQYMEGERENKLNKNSRKWLTYVWTLVSLRVSNESHIRSILSKEFCDSIGVPSLTSHSDNMKLLNIRAIAQNELKLKNLQCDHLDALMHHKIQQGNDHRKFTAKVREALNAIVSSSNELRTDIQTPFGFVIDFEMLFDEDLVAIPLGDVDLPSNFTTSKSVKGDLYSTGKRCALICVSYSETIANTQNDVVGYKKMISRILEPVGYSTVFLPENLMSHQGTSAEFVSDLKKLLSSSL